MAKVILRGMEDVSANRETLGPIQKAWADGELGERVTIDKLGVSFKENKIQGFEGLNEINTKSGVEDEYDLQNSQDKKTIKSFEREFKDWAEDKDYGVIEMLDRFFVHKEAIRLDEETYVDSPGFEKGDYKKVIVDPEKYEDLQAKWESLQRLEDQRNYAQKEEQKRRERVFEQIKQDTFSNAE